MHAWMNASIAASVRPYGLLNYWLYIGWYLTELIWPVWLIDQCSTCSSSACMAQLPAVIKNCTTGSPRQVNTRHSCLVMHVVWVRRSPHLSAARVHSPCSELSAWFPLLRKASSSSTVRFLKLISNLTCSVQSWTRDAQSPWTRGGLPQNVSGLITRTYKAIRGMIKNARGSRDEKEATRVPYIACKVLKSGTGTMARYLAFCNTNHLLFLFYSGFTVGIEAGFISVSCVFATHVSTISKGL